MKRISALTLAIALVTPSRSPALDRGKAAYVGGTCVRLNKSDGPVEGHLDTSSEDWLVFSADGQHDARSRLPIRYDLIQHLEYGQRAGRRVATAVGATVLAGPIGLASLAFKKRAHYLTVTYADDEGKDQVVILELGREIVRSTLATVEARSGKPIEYQDEEARKWSR
jgi:hypothetical protein